MSATESPTTPWEDAPKKKSPSMQAAKQRCVRP